MKCSATPRRGVANALLLALTICSGHHAAGERSDEQAETYDEGDLTEGRRARSDRGRSRTDADYGEECESEDVTKHRTNVGLIFSLAVGERNRRGAEVIVSAPRCCVGPVRTRGLLQAVAARTPSPAAEASAP